MLSLLHISKSFSGVEALKDVSISFLPGEVHAICGENGAGKSTLMNIIAGSINADAGKLLWNNQPLELNSISQAQELGISIVYQEGSLSDAMSVAENIFPVHQPLTRFGLIDFKQLNAKTKLLLDELELHNISPVTKVGRLSAAQKKMVEIAKALSKAPSLLILDEPTASLTGNNVEVLLRMLRILKGKGVSIIYISHRMEEINAIADKVSVLKDGRYQGTVDPKRVPTSELIKMMVGRELHATSLETFVMNDVKLQVESLSGKEFKNVSFTLNKGEIFGIAGLQGSGRTALAKSIFGDLKADSGKIFKDGRLIHPTHPSQAIENGIAYVPEDRKSTGLFQERSVADNIASTFFRSGWYDASKLSGAVRGFIKQFDIKAQPGQAVKKLSGGNQQKVLLAKWLVNNPDLLIINEPTHGVDVGAKSEIYTLLKKITAQGKSILLISSDLPEMLLLCDRIGVMVMGNLTRIFNKDEATEELITSTASGLA